jgi:hypothetical protein
MKPLCALFLAALVFGAADHAFAGAKKQSAVAVRFYGQGGGAGEGSDFSQPVPLLGSGQTIYMQTMPLITEKEITAYYPFQATDGSGTMGAYFKLDAHGSNLLGQHTMAHRTEYMLAFFNGRHIVDLRIDHGVTDGIVCIPRGLTPTDVELLSITFPEIGHESVSPSQKKKELAAREKQQAKTAKQSKAKSTPTPMPIPAPAMARQPDGSMAPAKAQ